MKVNYVMLCFAVLLSALIGYAFHAAGASTAVTTAGSVVSVLLLGAGMACSLEGRASVSFKTLMFAAFFVLLLLDAAFGCFGASLPVTVIINGIGLVATALVGYLIARSNV